MLGACMDFIPTEQLQLLLCNGTVTGLVSKGIDLKHLFLYEAVYSCYSLSIFFLLIMKRNQTGKPILMFLL